MIGRLFRIKLFTKIGGKKQMTTPINIHLVSIERLFSDNIITPDEYETIMSRLTSLRVQEMKEAKSNG